MKKALCFILAGTLAVSIALTGCTSNERSSGNYSQQNTANQTVQSSDLFQTMDTVDLDGNSVDSSTFSNYKITLVNVWNVGCKPCIEELGILDRLNREFEEQGGAVRGLYNGFTPATDLTSEEREEIAEILKAEGAEYPQWLPSQKMLDTDIFQQWDAFPGTFIVDSQGNILDKLIGDNDYEGWKQVMEDALRQVNENE